MNPTPTPQPMSGRLEMLRCARHHAQVAGAIARRVLPLARMANSIAEAIDGMTLLRDEAARQGRSQEAQNHSISLRAKKAEFVRLLEGLNEMHGTLAQHVVWCRLIRLQIGIDVIPESVGNCGDLTTARQVNRLDGSPINFASRLCQVVILEEEAPAPKRESKTY